MGYYSSELLSINRILSWVQKLKNMSDKKILKSTTDSKKTWNFSKGNVQLNFTLSVDVKQDMKDFLECLRAGIEAVENELKTIKK